MTTRTMTELELDPLLTIAEVADRLRLEKTTIRRWIKAGVLEAVTLPTLGKWHAYRVKQSTLDAVLGEKGA